MIAFIDDHRGEHGVEPFAYLKATLEAIASGHPNERLDELLPWNWAPASS